MKFDTKKISSPNSIFKPKIWEIILIKFCTIGVDSVGRDDNRKLRCEGYTTTCKYKQNVNVWSELRPFVGKLV